MPLSTKHRSSIYRSLSPLLGEEEAGALLNEFPAGEGDELVTKQFLRAELADLRGDLRAEFGDLRAEFGDLRAEFGDLRAQFGDLRGGLRAEIGDLRVEMHAGFRRQTMAMMTIVVSAMSVQTAAFAAVVALLR